MMFRIPHITLLIFLFVVLSCKEIVVEYFSPNDYFIENDSSEELYYYSIYDSLEIVIPINSVILIEETEPWGNISISGNDFFIEVSESVDKDIYLFRDSSGIKTQALKLNSLDDFDWNEEIVSEDKNSTEVEHVLIVTDEMLE